ncbi:helix-turn-helix domain-containing protein [Rhodococcus sp. (in: high G+C Gram-positive bacteria)]|uniref:helix-turn-helix domain-containing protein n=1 Tax=Rhodococcus sp. TaxID=1831 RepID=UPI001A1D0E37|nr:helix-turn-helix domain-containing protein [Rhodococcus sp. (in: high G+C Gram-positive bacteria)]MBJ7476801.1 helix-turn-helix domain-containing protein [Rhodococcus sp. (in: high G+C Gram-positive bacteria)]
MNAVQTHMSVKAIAERWNCDLTAVYRQVKARRLPALRVGNIIRVPIAAIEEFEAANTTIPENSQPVRRRTSKKRAANCVTN